MSVRSVLPRLTVFSTLLILIVAPRAGAARVYRGGAVATAHPISSRVALDMLNKGGNAADAAVAAAFALAVVGPYHSGIGGGGFALTHDATTGVTRVLDFREVAPKAASRDMYVRDGAVVPRLSTDGALSVAVPGAAMGYLELHAASGKLPRATVLAPAIQAARDGFRVTPVYRHHAVERVDCLRADEEASKLFLTRAADGSVQPPEVGTKVRQPDLARTLEALARSGADALHRGRLAKRIADTVQKKGGLLTTEDLAAFKVRWREPLEGSYRGHRVLTMPPPSAGGLAVLQVLGVLERGGPAALASRDPEVLHRYVEAVRRAYVDRAKYLGDPAFVDIPLARLASPEYIGQLAASIDPARATSSQSLLPVPVAASTRAPPSRDGGLERKNTTHVSVIDKLGNAVALTTTVNYSFGSCIVPPGTGVLLNDQMDDFAAKPMTPNVYGLVTGEANAVAPGKIPLSSMSPTLVFRREDPSRVMLAVGSPGGSTIPTTVIQVISNVVDAQMDIVRAVGMGRVHHQYLPDAITVDRWGIEPATQRALEARGHKVVRIEQWGDAEAVLVDPRTDLASAGSDPRNEGEGIGQD